MPQGRWSPLGRLRWINWPATLGTLAIATIQSVVDKLPSHSVFLRTSFLRTKNWNSTSHDEQNLKIGKYQDMMWVPINFHLYDTRGLKSKEIKKKPLKMRYSCFHNFPVRCSECTRKTYWHLIWKQNHSSDTCVWCQLAHVTPWRTVVSTTCSHCSTTWAAEVATSLEPPDQKEDCK